MEFDQIYNNLKNKIYHPLYFLSGEEPYYIDLISDYIEDNVLDDAEKDFNLTVLYGRESKLIEVVEHARRFPMMAAYQLVIVKEAQDLFSGNDFMKLNEMAKVKDFLEAEKNKDIIDIIKSKKIQSAKEAMSLPGFDKKEVKSKIREIFKHIDLVNASVNKPYIEFLNLLDKPVKSTILVFAYKYGKLDKRKAFTKKMAATGVLLESNRLYENKVPEWITNFLKKKDYSISIQSCALLADYLGTDLSKIANELDKLIINVKSPAKITMTHIEENIGISKDFNVFELQKSLGARDKKKTLQIINYFAANPKENPVVKTIAILHGFFTKLMILHGLKNQSSNNVATALSIHPFFVGEYQRAASNYSMTRLGRLIGVLNEYDNKAKGIGNVSLKDGELTREMILKILA